MRMKGQVDSHCSRNGRIEEDLTFIGGGRVGKMPNDARQGAEDVVRIETNMDVIILFSNDRSTITRVESLHHKDI